jgi:adenylate kinase family enzyme
VGTSGSGKSTFGKLLASKLNCPYIEMDQIYWGPNWKQPADEVFFDKLKIALNSDRWVLDGNYTRSIPVKWKNVEMVVWLDYSFSTTLYQAFVRALRRIISGKEIWEGTGNRETFSKTFFSKDSILLWMINTHQTVRLRYQALLIDPQFSHIQFVRLKSRKEAEEFLNSFEQINERH